MLNNELQRLIEVKRYSSLLAESKKQLDDIAKLAATICEVPIGMINFIEEEHQVTIAAHNVDVEIANRADSFCTHTIQQDDLLIVNHTDRNPLFASNPYVIGNPHIRFYAGMPLKVNSGYNIGSLCVLDSEPKTLTPQQEESLIILTKQAILLLELRMNMQMLQNKMDDAEKHKSELKSFYDNGQNFHFLLNREMQLLNFNSAMENFISRANGQQLKLGDVIIEYLHDENIDGFVESYIKCLEGEVVRQEQLVFHKISNDKVWWEISYTPVRNEHNTIIAVSFTAIDIQEKKKQSEELIQQNQRLNTIAEIQSHQIRKPVASIIGLMDLIKYDGYVFNQEYFNMLDISVKELDEKIHQIIN